MSLLLALQVFGGVAAGQSMIQDHWTMRQGLPQNSVTDLAQDDQGYVWLATYGGVVRFDGRSFSAVRVPGLTAQRFLTLWVDSERVWLGSEAGGLYLLADGRAQAIGPEEETWAIAPGLDGERLWIASRYEVFSVSRWGEPELGERLDVQVRAFHPWGDGLVGIGGAGSAICVEGDCGDFPQGPPLGGVQRWVGDGERFPLVASTAEGVYRLEQGQWVELVSLDAPSRYLPIPCAYWEQELWCSIQGEPFRPGVDPVERERVFAASVMVDQEHGLWVGTDGAGVYRHQKSGVDRPGPREPVLGVGPAGDDEVWAWIGLRALSISLRDGQVSGQAELDDLGNLWTAGERTLVASKGRIGVLEPSGQVRWLPGGLSDEYMQPAAEGPWFGQGAELFWVGERELKRVTSLAGEGVEVVVPLRGDDQRVWVQGDRHLLLLLDSQGKVLERIPMEEPAKARDVHPRAAGGIWVATYGGGILAVDQGRVVGRVGLAEGGCDDMVSHFFTLPGDPSIWVNTNRGLGRLDEATLEEALAGRGLANCHLQGSPEGNGPRGFVSAKGQIVAPSIEGLVVLDPAQANEQSPPRVLLESLYYGTLPLEEGDHVRGPGNLTVELSGIYFRDPHILRFRYRLLGLDDQWSELEGGDLRVTGLPPGEYTLQIQARADGAWGPMVERSFVREASWMERPVFSVWLPLGLSVGVMSVLGSALVLARRRTGELQAEVQRRERVQGELAEQQRENQEIQAAIEAGRRMDSLGRLSAGMAHDFNNLFTVVRLHAAILEGHEDPEVQEEARGLIEVVESGADVAKGLLTFGRGSSDSLGSAPICEAARARIPLLRRLIRADLQIIDGVCLEDDVHVGISRGQVDQILTNLVLNARDATPGPGRIWVEVNVQGDSACLQVRDEGLGMQPHELGRALEPYFTTKTLGRGTGLGLSTIHGIVRSVGGSFELESEPGSGTTARVLLPIVEPGVQDAPQQAPKDIDLSGLRLLVVDDNLDLLRSIKVYLEEAGVQVIAFDQPLKVLDRLAERPLDLALLDVVMPGISGPDLRDALIRQRPDLRVVFMSGYTGREAGLRPSDRLLQKPFSPEQLKAALARAIA